MCEWPSTTDGRHHSAVPGNAELPTETDLSVRKKSCLRPVVTALCVLQTYFGGALRSLVPTKISFGDVNYFLAIKYEDITFIRNVCSYSPDDTSHHRRQ
jgi:hypothetical protein